MPIPVLASKLLVPQMTPGHIKRTNLLSNLISSVNTERHLTLICAPAGYGKTTLALEILQEMGCSCSWFTIDKGDNDISRFMTYLVATLEKSGIDFGEGFAHLVLDPNFNTIGNLLPELINNILGFAKRLTLVLDDFHFIKSKEIYSILKLLIESQPPNLHILITTREDPLIPLSRLRVSNRITEIRMKELCFSDKEAGEFFSKGLNISISSELMSRIRTATEGWVAGMQLIGLLLKGVNEAQVEEVLIRFDNNSYVIDYLVEEVLDRQSRDTQDFLCKTSILDRMNADLCNELTGRSDSSEILKRLEKANLFIIPLDSSRDWYRYHPLFADSLRMELTEQVESELYRKAALWMMKEGMYQDAVTYAFRANDWNLALKFVEESTERVFQNAELDTFIQWLDRFPSDMVKSSEVVSIRKSIALYFTGKVEEAVEYLQSLGENLEQRVSNHNKGLIFSLKAMIASYSGKDSEVLAKEALNFLEPWDTISRTFMLNIIGSSYYRKGKIDEAVKTYRLAYESSQKMSYTLIATLVIMNYGACLNATGALSEAIELFNRYIDGMRSRFVKPLPIIGIIYVALSELYYEKNDIAAAKSYLEKGIALCSSISFTWPISGVNHANIMFAAGEKEEAIKMLKKLLHDSQSTNVQKNRVYELASLIQLLIRMRRFSDAEHCSVRLDKYLCNKNEPGWDNAAISFSRMLLYRGALKEAEELLVKVNNVFVAGHNRKGEITVNLLLSSVCKRSGRQKESADYLAKAAALAAPEGYIRLFLDEEPVVYELLPFSVPQEKRAQELFCSIQSYFSENANKLIEPTNKLMNNDNHKVEKNTLLEFGDKLKERELEVLNLIADGKSNAEISKELYLSINTTQWHISNIYSKLGVKSRTQAILKAKEFGII